MWLPPPDLLSLCPLSSTDFVEPPPGTKFLGTPLLVREADDLITLRYIPQKKKKLDDLTNAPIYDRLCGFYVPI